MQYTPSMIACWANQEIMSDKVNLYASGLVRALFPVFQSRGPRRDRPPADCSYPGLAWHTELGSNAALLTLPVTSGSGKRFAAASRDGPPLGSDGRSWPSSLPGPCLPPSTAPFLPLPPGPRPSLLPRPRASPSLLVLAPPSFPAAFLPLPPPFLFRVPPSVHGPCLPLPPLFLSRALFAVLAPVRLSPPRTCVRELGR